VLSLWWRKVPSGSLPFWSVHRLERLQALSFGVMLSVLASLTPLSARASSLAQPGPHGEVDGISGNYRIWSSWEGIGNTPELPTGVFPWPFGRQCLGELPHLYNSACPQSSQSLFTAVRRSSMRRCKLGAQDLEPRRSSALWEGRKISNNWN
jgi:hypothetical protein